MAARQKREKKPASESVASPLHAEILRALRRLVAIEGSIAATARVLQIIAPSLELDRRELSRWLQRGIPKGALSGDREAGILFALVARLKRYDVDQPARDARDRKIQESRAAEEILRTFRTKRERERLIGELRGWCRRHDEVARFRGLRQSGVQRFADELGVRAELLRQAIRPGRESMSVKLFQAFRRFLDREAEQAVEDEIDRAKMDELMELARVPSTIIIDVQRRRRGKTVWVKEERQEEVTPKVPSGSWEFSGEGTHGWRWGMKLEKYLLPRLHPSGKDGWKTVEDFVRFALGVPGLEPAWRYPEWNVYALASELGDNAVGSKSAEYRYLGGHEDARRFVVSEAYSGGNRRPPRARERSISSRKTETERQGFIQHVGEGLDGSNVIFLHGGIAWNFRRRTEDEKKRIEKARKENVDLQDLLEKVRSRKIVEKKKKAKRVHRKKVLAGVLARRAEKKQQAASSKQQARSKKRRSP